MELIRHFNRLGKNDVGLAGGKGASLGEMTGAGICVPEGFVVLSGAFERFIEECDLSHEIDSLLHKVNNEDINSVEKASEAIKNLILNAKMPKDIALEINGNFKKLGVKYVAVRSSATSEDSASAAWAGQLDSFLNTSEKELLENVKKCWASLFTPRAIFYRFEKNLHGTEISVAVVVQKMVESEVSGIAFSVHPVTEDYNQLIIEAGFGLGEAIVSGQITPDSYVVEKNPRRIVDKNMAEQMRGLFRAKNGGNEWLEVKNGERQKLSDKEILELSELILKIEKHYGFPCDIEWAREGGKFYIVQSRPITTLTQNEGLVRVLDGGKDFEAKDDRYLKLDKIIDDVKNRTILFNYPGNIFYISHAFYWSIDETLRRFGSVQPYMLVYFKGDVARGETDIYSGFGEEIFSRLDKDPNKFIEEIRKENTKYEKIIDSFLEKNSLVGKELSLNDYTNLIKSSSNLLIEAVAWYNICLVVDKYFEKIRGGLFKKYNLSLSHDELISIGLSKEPPAVLLRDSYIWEYISFLKKNGMENSSYSDILKDKLAFEGLKKCYSLGYFQSAGYGGVKLWTLNDEFNLVKEHIGNSKQLDRQMEERKIYVNKFNNLWKNASKNKELKFWIGNFVYFSYMRDLRKVMEQKIWYFQAECLEKISKIIDIKREDLEYLNVKEFTPEFLNRSDVKEIISSRKNAFLWVWSKDTGHLFFSGNDATEFYKKHSIESRIKSSQNKELKGFSASSGKVKGRARVIFNAHSVKDYKEGSILVTSMTTPEFVPLMKKSSAIITELGGLTCHAAIIARELRKPCIIGIDRVTQIIRDGDEIEVDAYKGIVKILNGIEVEKDGGKREEKKDNDKGVGESLLDKYKRELGNQEIHNPVPNFTLLSSSLRWSSKKYYSKNYDNYTPLPVLSCAKGSDSFAVFSVTHGKNCTREIFLKYWKDKETLINRLKLQNSYIKKIGEIYEKVSNEYVENTDLNILKDILIKALDVEININSLGWWGMFWDREFVVELLEEVGSNITEKRLNEIWDRLIVPSMESFEKRSAREVIIYLSENRSWKDIAEKVQYIYAGFFGVSSLSYAVEELKKEYGELDSSARLKELDRDIRRIKDDYGKWFSSLNKEEQKLVEFGQECIKMRDALRDYVGRFFIILDRIGKKIISQAGISEKYLHFITFDELLLDNKRLKLLKEEISERFDKGVALLVHNDDSLEVKIGKYEEIKKGLEEFYYNQQGIDITKEVQELKGQTACPGKVKGNVRIIVNFIRDANNMQEGEILVTGMTRPEYVPLMKKASAIVTDEGGVTSHAAIVSRELKKPCIIGTKIATKILKDGDLVEVDADNGIVKILNGNDVMRETKRNEKVKLSKYMSREHSLFYAHVWSESNRDFFSQTFKDTNIKNMVFLLNNKGMLEVYYELKELDEVFNKISQELSKNLGLIDGIIKEFYKYWNMLFPYISGKKKIKNLSELKELYSNWVRWWSPMAELFVIPDIESIPKKIRDKALKVREETQEYGDDGDKVFIDFIERNYPKYKDIVNLLTPEEAFKVDKLSKKEIDLIRRRAEGCALVTFNGSSKLISVSDLEKEAEKKGVVVEGFGDVKGSFEIKGLGNEATKHKYKKEYVRDLPLILVEGFITGIFEVYKDITDEDLKYSGMIIFSKEYIIEEWMNDKVIEELTEKIFEENSKSDEFFQKYVNYYKEHLDRYSKIESFDNIADFKRYIKSLYKALEGFIVFYFSAGNDKTPKEILIRAREIRDKDTLGDDSDKIIRQSFSKIIPYTKNYESVISKEDLDNIPEKKILEKRIGGFVSLPGLFIGLSSLKEFSEKYPQYEFISTMKDEVIKEFKGFSAFKGKVKGRVRIIIRKKDMDSLKSGEILVSPMTTPDFLPAMKRASAIVTDEGGIVCHASIVARELKKPCVIGTRVATQVLRDGDLVEVDADNGIVRILERKS